MLMAFDALRLRNVIQLFGLLRTSRQIYTFSSLTHLPVVFHAAMLVFASIEIHETQAALSTRADIWHRVERFLIVSPIMIGLSWFALMWYVRILYHEFGYAAQSPLVWRKLISIIAGPYFMLSVPTQQ